MKSPNTEKRLGSYATGVKKNPPHAVTAAEIREAFILVGWVGKRRKPQTFIKVAPYTYETGPGIGR